MKHLSKALSGLAMVMPLPAIAQSAGAYPVAEDIVRAEPVSLGAPGGTDDVARYLLVRSPQKFAISPDGKQLAYSSDVTGSPQIWIVPATGGFPQQLTYGSGIDDFHASPDGRHLLYAADSDGDERVGMNLLALDGLTERNIVAKSSAFRLFGTWSPDGTRFAYASTERNGRDFDIWIADVATGQSRMIYQGAAGFQAEAWQPGGDLLVLSETRGESANDLHLLNAMTGERTTLFRPERPARYAGINWAPDGSGFYLATNQDGDHDVIAFYDLATRSLRTVAEPGHDVNQVGLSSDGRFLAWTTIETGFDVLHLRDLQKGEELKVPDLPRGTIAFQFADRAAVLALRTDSAREPGQIWTYDLESGQLTLTVPVDSPGLDLSRMVVPEPVAFAARDGAPLTGLLYMPEKALGGEKPPVFLAVHGGPSAYATPGFEPDIQYYVARGIAVLDLNYRGSTGQGRSFAELNDRENKVNEVGDLADAVAWLASTGRVDARRVAVGGGSYGGYLTNQALGTYPDLFVAGVSAVGVSDWVTALEGASPSLKASDRLEFGDIADPKVRAFFAGLSPINNVDKIKAPLMVLHGANDPRDPVTESDRLVAGIRKNGGQVTYLRFPDEGHGISKLANRVHAYRRIAAFLEEQFSKPRP